jgi:hypothetical protein
VSEERRSYIRDNAAAAMVAVRDYLRALADDDELATSALLAQEAADYLPQGSGRGSHGSICSSRPSSVGCSRML